MDDAPQHQVAGERPATPGTADQIRLSLKVLRIGFLSSIVLIAIMTFVFVAYLDAPEIPLVPIAAIVIVVDIVMLVAFTRQRKAALAEIEQGHAGLQG
jgi:hypothetical protein